MGRHSRDKGARGEREWRDILRALGCNGCERGRQRHGGPDSPDVRHGIPGTHAEVKRYKRIAHFRWMEQAVKESGQSLPYLATREDGGEWLVTIRASDIPRFAQCFAAIEGRPVYPIET